MSAPNQPTEGLVEICSVGTSHPQLTRRTANTPHGDVQYLNQRELCPELALTLSAGVAGTLERRFDIRGHLRTLYRLSAAAHLDDKLDARCALLLAVDQNGNDSRIEELRSYAARALAGLWRSPHRGIESVGFLLEGEEALDANELAQGPLGKLLGQRMAHRVDVHVAARKPLRYEDRFRAAPRQSPYEEILQVHGARLQSTKTAGRYRSVAVTGLRQHGAGFELFNEKRVLFDETERHVISKAIGEPRRSLRMTITRITAPNSTIKPTITHKLGNLSFEE